MAALFGVVALVGAVAPVDSATAGPGFVLSVTKTASPTTYTAAGQTITYTYVVTATDPDSASFVDTITVTDDKVSSISCPGTYLAALASMTCTGSYTTTAADVTAGSVTNTVTVNGDVSLDNIGDTATNSATITFTPQPSWTLSKSASPTTYTASGQSIAYTYTLENTGNVSISGISVSDNKIAAVTCAATTLAVGASTTCSGSYTTTSADVTAGTVTNNATATGTPSSGTLSDATASATITLNPQPSWTLGKSASPTTYTASGQTIAYTYTLENTGNVSISGISVSDDKVSTVTCSATSLAVGASTTCSGSYTTTSADVTAGSVKNTATATGTPLQGTLSDATANATITLNPQPSWTLSKSASPTTYTASGQSIAYTYTLENTGNVSISGISVSDDKISTVTCSATSLAVGASTTCSGSYTTTSADVTAGSVTNNATATGTPSSGTLTDATASATITFSSNPSWTLSKTADPTTYTAAGQSITYTYTLNNTGNLGITGITVSDDKIATVSCPSTALSAGASMTCTATYTTTAADVTAGSVTNTASASGTVASSAIVSSAAIKGAAAVSAASKSTLANATATATITLLAQPAWTLTKTANPTTYSGASQTITYTYTLNNTGNVSISAISVSDDKVASVNCAATTLAIGASTTCSGSYTTTVADVTAGSVTNAATAHGTPASGTLSDATTNATVRYRVVTGSITIVKTALGGDGRFQFTSTLAGSKQFTLTTLNGTASQTFSGLVAGTYTFTEVDLPLHWKLSSLACTGDMGGRVTTEDLSGRTATIGLDGGEAIVCTFTNAFDVTLHRKLTHDAIRNFLGRRLRMLADSGPDRARFVRRLPGSLWGRGRQSANAAVPAVPSEPFNVAGESGPLSSRFSFSTSLSQVIHASMTVPDKAKGQQDAASEAPNRNAETRSQNTGIDLWAEAHYRNFRDADSMSNFAILYVGADYLVTPSVLVGALVQRDWTVERSTQGGKLARGTGTMGGPYISARLTPNLFFDARAAWGTSDNTINPFGLYADRFSTDRWLVSSRLTGNLVLDRFRVTPSLALDYIEENQHSYTDSLGVFIPGQTVALGRFAFGPEVARQYLYSDGTIVEPQLELTGVWDFENPDVSPISSLYDGHANLHASIRGGLQVHRPDGVSIRVTSSYDGLLTDSFGSFGAQVWLNVPLE